MTGGTIFPIAFILRRRLARARNIRRDNGGVAAVEFAIIVPILVGSMISIVDLGLGLYTQVQLANAAQAGAAYAIQKGYNAEAMTTVAQAATRLTDISVTSSQFCGCPSPGGMTTTSCTASCSDGLTAGTFAQVTVTKDYSTLLPYPGLPDSFHMSEQATARTQ